MKLLSFLRNGNTGFGLVKNNGIIDLSGTLGDDVRTIKKVLELDLLDLIEDKALQKKISKNARNLYSEEFEFNKVYDGLVLHLEELASI